jgi:hypothetical protein
MSPFAISQLRSNNEVATIDYDDDSDNSESNPPKRKIISSKPTNSTKTTPRQTNGAEVSVATSSLQQAITAQDAVIKDSSFRSQSSENKVKLTESHIPHRKSSSASNDATSVARRKSDSDVSNRTRLKSAFVNIKWENPVLPYDPTTAAVSQRVTSPRLVPKKIIPRPKPRSRIAIVIGAMGDINLEGRPSSIVKRNVRPSIRDKLKVELKDIPSLLPVVGQNEPVQYKRPSVRISRSTDESADTAIQRSPVVASLLTRRGVRNPRLVSKGLKIIQSEPI